jgi:hypothetical protein
MPPDANAFKDLSFGPPSEPRKMTGIDVLVASDDRRITAIYTFVDPVKG